MHQTDCRMKSRSTSASAARRSRSREYTSVTLPTASRVIASWPPMKTGSRPARKSRVS